MRPLATSAFVLALLAGTTAAFALAQMLKLERSPIAAPRFDRLFSPVCGCESSTAKLSLRLRRADTVDAEIVDAGGERVAVLAAGMKRPSGPLRLEWDGRDDAGQVVPDGRYRLRIQLERQGRVIVVPTAIQVDSTAPAATVVFVRSRVFSPDGDGRRDRLAVAYRASDPARASLRLRGTVVKQGRFVRAGRSGVVWDGTLKGRTLRAGTYVLDFEVTDRAGNRSPAERITARIRFVELARQRFRVPRAGVLRFRVATDARRFRWSLLRLRRGRPSPTPSLAGGVAGNVAVVRLPQRLRPGRFRLRVLANGHLDLGTVVVTRRPRPGGARP